MVEQNSYTKLYTVQLTHMVETEDLHVNEIKTSRFNIYFGLNIEKPFVSQLVAIKWKFASVSMCELGVSRKKIWGKIVFFLNSTIFLNFDENIVIIFSCQAIVCKYWHIKNS